MMKSFTTTTISQQHANFAVAPFHDGPTKADLDVVRQIDHFMGQFGKKEQETFRQDMEADFGKDWYCPVTATKLPSPPPSPVKAAAPKKNRISIGSRGRRLRSNDKVKSLNSFKRGSSPFPRTISIPTNATMMIPTETNDCPLTTLEYERKSIFYLQESPCKATLMFSGKMMGVFDRKIRHSKRTTTLPTMHLDNDEVCATPSEKMGYFTKHDTTASGDYDGCASVVESDISESDDDETVIVTPPRAKSVRKVAAHKTAPTTTGRVGRTGRLSAWLFPKKALPSPPATMPEFHSGPKYRIRQVKRIRRFRLSSFNKDQTKNQV